MQHLSLVEGKLPLNPATTIDLTVGLGYGLFFQPVIGKNPSSAHPFVKPIFSSPRRRKKREQNP